MSERVSCGCVEARACCSQCQPVQKPLRGRRVMLAVCAVLKAWRGIATLRIPSAACPPGFGRGNDCQWPARGIGRSPVAQQRQSPVQWTPCRAAGQQAVFVDVRVDPINTQQCVAYLRDVGEAGSTVGATQGGHRARKQPPARNTVRRICTASHRHRACTPTPNTVPTRHTLLCYKDIGSKAGSTAKEANRRSKHPDTRACGTHHAQKTHHRRNKRRRPADRQEHTHTPTHCCVSPTCILLVNQTLPCARFSSMSEQHFPCPTPVSTRHGMPEKHL